MPPDVGRRAPELVLRDQHGQTVALSSYLGTSAVVLMFFPFAFSRVCTGELRAVRDAVPPAADGAQVLGISCDPMFSLRAFADQEGLRFPLLSDFWPHGAVARAYGVLDERAGCATRSTFIVDRAGVLRWQVHNAMPQARDIEEQARVLSEVVGVV